MLFNLYVFNRMGTCLYFQEYKRTSKAPQQDVQSVCNRCCV